MNLAERVLRSIRARGIIAAHSRLLVALSGGPDSVALTCLLREIAPLVPLTLAGLVHVNHRLRPSADQDEAFCRQLAQELDLPFESVAVDVRALAAGRHLSLEDAGRKARYAAFERVRAEFGADLVATGHTRDDQAETFLLRLLRGAGTRGLSGIYPIAGRVVRPLLDVHREELRQYLSERGRTFCEDESNRDLTIPRNRVRHELLTYLAREFSPAVVDVLARAADLARADADYLDRKAIDLARSIVLQSDGGSASRVRAAPDGTSSPTTVEVDVAALVSLHPALASRVARLALERMAPDKFIGFEHVADLLALAAGPATGGMSLPGQHAERIGGRVALTRELVRPFSNSFRVSLSIPGEVVLEREGWVVSAESGSDPNYDSRGSDPHSAGLVAALRADRIRLPLAVRSRRPGDRFRPQGLGGRHRKLQDVFVDRKIARARRDAIPLVVDGNDQILWIVGVSVAEDFQVTEPSQGVIFLKARRLGGPG